MRANQRVVVHAPLPSASTHALLSVGKPPASPFMEYLDKWCESLGGSGRTAFALQTPIQLSAETAPLPATKNLAKRRDTIIICSTLSVKPAQVG